MKNKYENYRERSSQLDGIVLRLQGNYEGMKTISDTELPIFNRNSKFYKGAISSARHRGKYLSFHNLGNSQEEIFSEDPAYKRIDELYREADEAIKMMMVEGACFVSVLSRVPTGCHFHPNARHAAKTILNPLKEIREKFYNREITEQEYVQILSMEGVYSEIKSNLDSFILHGLGSVIKPNPEGFRKVRGFEEWAKEEGIDVDRYIRGLWNQARFAGLIKE